MAIYSPKLKKTRNEGKERNILIGALTGAIILGGIGAFLVSDRAKYNKGEELLRSHNETLEYTTQKGDTYWDIARKYFPDKVRNNNNFWLKM